MTKSEKKPKEKRTELVLSPNGECSHLVVLGAEPGENRVLWNNGELEKSFGGGSFKVPKGIDAWAANNRLRDEGLDDQYVVVESSRGTYKLDETNRVLPPGEDSFSK